MKIGNTRGNIINDGLAVKKDDWIYYSNITSDDGKLYRMNLKGTIREKICDDSANYINVLDNWIYYANDKSIFKIRTDKKQRIKLIEENNEVDEVIVIDNYIYYSVGCDENNKLYKVDINGKNKNKIAENICFVNIVGEDAYATANCGEGIYKISLTKKKSKKKITNDKSWYLNFENDYLYYVDEENRSISKIRVDEMKTTILYNYKWVPSINIFNGWIYFTEFYLYKMKIDGTNKVKLNNDQSNQINIVEDWVYYIIFDDGKDSLYRIKTNGSNREIIV